MTLSSLLHGWPTALNRVAAATITRIQIIVGGQDNPTIRNHADDYFKVLQAAHQPMLTWQQVPRMAHQIEQSQEGLDALFSALTEGKRDSKAIGR